MSVDTSQDSITPFQVSVTDDLAKQFCVLVYYIEDNNDVVADATCLETEESFRNDVRSLQAHEHTHTQHCKSKPTTSVCSYACRLRLLDAGGCMTQGEHLF